MAANEQMPTWRNALAWAAVGLIFCGGVMLGATALLQEGGLVGAFGGGGDVEPRAIVSIGGALALASLLVGFSKRREPLDLRAVGNFVLLNIVALAIFALAVWIYQRLAGTVPAAAMGGSETVARILGLALVGLALLCIVLVAAAHSRAGVLTGEQAEDTRQQGRVTIYSAIWMAVTGLTLVVLSLAGPGGAVSPAMALAFAVVLLGISAVVTFAIWPLLDELSRTLSRESGNAAFHLIWVVGGGWAIVAHLGFVPAPTPLDWLTMLVLFSFAASVIAIGRRGLLKAR